ncbi:MAG: hypothetical protein CME32_06455 [Gimesia sp.]|jgi:hypothetical protein|nr:hypothetical protein [Gimesia sp.]
MSVRARIRKKEWRRFRRVYGAGEIQSGRLRIESVHQIPDQIETGDEFDFWIHNGTDLLLITLESQPEARIHYLRSQWRDHLYIRVQFDFHCLSEPELIKIVQWIIDLGIPDRGRIRKSRSITVPFGSGV